MNIRQLKQFVTIAETGNISRSAKQQNISQPALTRSLQNLEEDLGVELIERRANGVFLTSYGEHLLEYAQTIVSDSERVRREISAMKSGLRGRLSIGVGPSFSTGVLSTSVDRLLAYGSQLEIQLVESFIEDLCADLRKGELDVVLSLFPANYDVSDLNFSSLCEVESVLVARNSHKLTSVKNVSKHQLANANWVIADQKYAISIFREFLSRTEIPASAHHIRANSMRLIKSLVLESDYLTILPRILIEEELKSGKLTIIDGPVKPLVSTGGIAWRNSGYRSAALRDFVQIVEEEFAGSSASAKHKYNAVTPLF